MVTELKPDKGVSVVMSESTAEKNIREIADSAESRFAESFKENPELAKKVVQELRKKYGVTWPYEKK